MFSNNSTFSGDGDAFLVVNHSPLCSGNKSHEFARSPT